MVLGQIGPKEPNYNYTIELMLIMRKNIRKLLNIGIKKTFFHIYQRYKQKEKHHLHINRNGDYCERVQTEYWTLIHEIYETNRGWRRQENQENYSIPNYMVFNHMNMWTISLWHVINGPSLYFEPDSFVIKVLW